MMSFERFEKRACVSVPDADRHIVAGAGDSFAVRRIRGRVDPAFMRSKQGDLAAEERVVDPYADAAGGGDPPTVRRIVDRMDRPSADAQLGAVRKPKLGDERRGRRLNDAA